MAVVGKRTFKATILFQDAPVDEKLWLKWKGRKAAVGWNATRTRVRIGKNWNTNKMVPQGHIQFTCTRPECYDNMTPERIEDILAMISLIKKVPYSV